VTQLDDARMDGLPPLERALEDGWTLPASWYSDSAVFAAERAAVFASAWQYAGWTDQVSEPDSYFVSVAGHLPVVVTRAADGVLRAFVNVCRHRGHLVAEGSGCRATLQCPYHAWTYGLDGSLRRAPRSEREPGFDATGLSLVPVSVDTWGPFVFVNPDPEPQPLADALGDVPALIGSSGVEIETLRFHSHHEWEQEVNWKVAIENYLECYHCPVAHPGFSKLIDVAPDSYRLRHSGLASSQIGAVRAAALEGRTSVPYDPHGDVLQSQYHLIYPNTTINIVPGPQNLSIERWVPVEPRLTVEVTDYFFGSDVADERIEDVIAFDTQVAEEDLVLVRSVQKGLDTGAVPQGRVLPGSEQLLVDFQRRVRDALVARR